MITAFGTGIGGEFDISKARYHKIVIMTEMLMWMARILELYY